MKKGVLFLVVLFLVFAPIISATTNDELRQQVQRAAFYAENYEAANPDYTYAKLLVYFYSVEKDINALLKIKGDTKISSDNLVSIFGAPSYTTWVSDLDDENEIEVDDSVPIWMNKIIFDGDLIQTKINVIPYLDLEKEIIYKSDLNFVLKQPLKTADLIAQISEIKELANEYSLAGEDEDKAILSANSLAESSINNEVYTENLFKQSDDLEKTMYDIFGEENIIKEETVATKDFEIYNKDKKAYVTVSTCEDCSGIDSEKWINLDLSLENENGVKIGYYLDEVATGEFAEMGINQLKIEMINTNKELINFLENENFAEAYNKMNELEILGEFMSEKINEGDEGEVIKNYISILDFYLSENGLFGSYPLVRTDYYNEKKFQKIIYLDYNNKSEEICYNKFDDNHNNQTDCEEEFCSGQICDTRVIQINDSGIISNKTINYYCIQGMCQEKQENKTKREGFCGNGVCEEGEETSCAKDCFSNCQNYSAIDCSGKVIYKGVDENGCPLPPICIGEKDVCQTDSDCEQPLCGKSTCVIGDGGGSGECVLSAVLQCSQAECVDGEKKTCQDYKTEILTDICELGKWKKTGQTCETGEAPSTITEPSQGILTKNVECKDDEAFVAGVCKSVAKNSNVVEKSPSTIKTEASTLTGFTINIGLTGENVVGTGNQITANPITGVVPDPDTKIEGVLDKPTSLPPPRKYDGEAPTSKITGGVKTFEEIELPEAQTKNLDKSNRGDRNLPKEVKDAYILEGVLRNDGTKQEAIVYYSASGENFGAISDLLDRYRLEGAEQLSYKLQLLRYENQELAKTLNNDWAKFFENYLVSQTDMDKKRDILYSIYNYNFEKKQEMAELMNGLKIRSLDYTSDDFINLNYKSKILDLKMQESLKQAKFSGLREVEIPVMSMDAEIIFPKDFVKESYETALDGHKFVSENTYRQNNFGLTDEEIRKFRNDEEIKSKISKLVSEKVDGSFDAQVSFVDNDGNEVYSLFVSLENPENANPIKVTVLPADKMPTGLDAKITANFDSMYELMEATEKGSWKYTLHSSLDKSFRPREQIDKVIDWFRIRNKVSNVESSLKIEPDNSEIKGVFMDFVYLFGDPGKPSDLKE